MALAFVPSAVVSTGRFSSSSLVIERKNLEVPSLLRSRGCTWSRDLSNFVCVEF
jgi:hypothetical protein